MGIPLTGYANAGIQDLKGVPDRRRLYRVVSGQA